MFLEELKNINSNTPSFLPKICKTWIKSRSEEALLIRESTELEKKEFNNNLNHYKINIIFFSVKKKK